MRRTQTDALSLRRCGCTQVPNWLSRYPPGITGSSCRIVTDCSAEQLNHKLMAVIQQRFSFVNLMFLFGPWVDPQPRSIVFQKWKRLFWARQGRTGKPLLMHITHSWYHMSRHLALRKQLRRACHERRRQRIHEVTDQAIQAAAIHDSRGLYEAIRKHTPRQTKTIRFRDSIGKLLDPQAELATLHQHFEQLFQAAQPVPPGHQSKPLILAVEEIEHQLLKTRVHTAVAPGTPPAAVVHALAPQVAGLRATWPCSRP